MFLLEKINPYMLYSMIPACVEPPSCGFPETRSKTPQCLIDGDTATRNTAEPYDHVCASNLTCLAANLFLLVHEVRILYQHLSSSSRIHMEDGEK